LAEAGALACVLSASNGEGEACLDRLAPEDFYDLRHQAILAGLYTLRAASKPLDVVSLRLQLRITSKLDDAGGEEYLAHLPDATPSPANWPAWLETVKAFATRRTALADAGRLALLARDPAVTPATLADAARRMLDAHSRNVVEALPPIEDASDFLAQPIAQPPELVWGILHQGSKGVLGGGSKTFKTWTLLDLAVSVAAGEPWLSFKTTKGKVLFLNFEIAPAFFQRRIQAVADAKGIALAPHALEVWNLRGWATGYRDLLPQIRRRIKDAGYSLLVLDPIYKLYGETDENSAGEVAHLMNALELVTVDTGASIAFGAHYAKGNAAAKEAIDRISGSGVFARDPDSILNFTRHEEADAFTVEATLRNHKPIEPFVVRWQFPLMRRCDELDPAKLKQAGGRPKLYTVTKLLTVLGGQKMNSQNWLRIASLETGISKSRFFALLEEAKRNPKLKQTLDGQWFYEDATA
jgi:hypothetical protein